MKPGAVEDSTSWPRKTDSSDMYHLPIEENINFDGPMPATRGESLPVMLCNRSDHKLKIPDEEFATECAEFAHILKMGPL